MLWSPPLAPTGDDAWTAAEAADFDTHLQRDLGLPAMLLMENAAAAQTRRAVASTVDSMPD